MKVGFDVKYGHNEIDIPIEQYIARLNNGNFGLRNVFTGKVTIYNDTPADNVNSRRFDRFVIDRCLIYNQLTESADGVMQKTVNAQNVIIKDIEHYKPPAEYDSLAEYERKNFYTVKVNDFVVLDEVDDVVTNSQEWIALQKKYKKKGFTVISVNASIFGMNADNIQITLA